MYGKGIVELLVERTQLELGRTCELLASGSHAKVFVKCTRCNEEFIREYCNLHQLHACPVHIVRDNIKLKWCNGCSLFLPHRAFENNAARYDGLSSVCKVCLGQRPKRRRQHTESIAERRTPNGWLKWSVSAKRALCRRTGMPFDLDYDYLLQLYERQNGLCAYSGISLEFGTKSLRSASLERRDSARGYVRGNVVLASKAMNWAKNDTSVADWLLYLGELLNNRRRYARVEIKIVHRDGQFPFRKRATDAGYDVAAISRTTIEPHSVVNVDTGIIVSPPEGVYFSVEGRSSLWRIGIVPLRGIIDATYQGPLMVAIVNNSPNQYTIEAGDRIAQLILHETINADFMAVAEFSQYDGGRTTEGFGSSGR